MLAYFWDSIKLQRIGKLFKKANAKWAAAADLALWCLQGRASRRPANMQQVFTHKFFDADAGVLQFLSSTEEDWGSFVRRQAAGLHAAIDNEDSVKVCELIAQGGADISMIDESILGSTVRPLHRAAFAGNAEVMRVLLVEVQNLVHTNARMHIRTRCTCADTRCMA